MFISSRNAVLILVALVILAGAGYWYFFMRSATPTTVEVIPTPVATSTEPVGSTYSDSTFGFSFAYPAGTKIVEIAASSTTEFPGAKVMREIQVGEPGDVTVFEVTSAKSVITDEPNGHASPISQTKYFYDAKAQAWMVAYPEGKDDGTNAATTTATILGTTDGGLSILPSGRRFDTRIIPLSPTKFVVVTSGGGASTDAVAQSVKPAP